MVKKLYAFIRTYILRIDLKPTLLHVNSNANDLSTKHPPKNFMPAFGRVVRQGRGFLYDSSTSRLDKPMRHIRLAHSNEPEPPLLLLSRSYVVSNGIQKGVPVTSPPTPVRGTKN